MEFPGQDVIAVLTYLLPGFITAAVVYSLTPAPRPIPFERVVQALIFTMLVQVCVVGIGFALREAGSVVSVGAWTDNVRLAWSVLVAGALGLAVAWAANTDRLHAVLRALRVTCQTSFSSEWYGAFSRNKGYVVLHLTGQRRLYGWPEEWPSTPGTGHFVMAQAEWLSEEARTELSGVKRILVKAEDVEMVEMMEVRESPQEKQDGRSQTTNTAAATAVAHAGALSAASAPAAIQTPAAATTTAKAMKAVGSK
jgi:hypothetical protein